MDKAQRNAALAAFLILGGFALVAYLMPTIMLAVGRYSGIAAAVVASAFVLAFFGVFWLRARHQRKRRGEREEEF